MKKNLKKGTGYLFSSCTSIFIFLLLTVFLFYTGRQGYQQILDAKFSTFLAICGGYIGLMVLLMAESSLIGDFRLPPPKALLAKSSWSQRLVFLYLIITWVSAILSPHYPNTIVGASRNEGALTITIYCLTFLFVSIFARIEKWMLPLFGASVFLFDILCIFQLFGLNPFTLYPEGYNYFGANVHYGGAYLGTIGNVDLVAAFLCIAIPILWISVLRCGGKKKYLLLFPLAASLFVLVKMWVLAGLVGVFCGAVLTLGVVLPVNAKAKKIIWGIVASCATLALLLLFFVDIGAGLPHEIHEILHGNISDSFGSGRIYIWKCVLERIPSQLLFGSGPDTMMLAEFKPFTRFDEALNTTIVAQIDIAHNDYLNILYHQGLFALLAYLAVLIDIARKWLMHSDKSCEIAVLGGSALSYCIQAFFGFSFCGTSVYFWVLLGLLVCISNKRY